MSSGTVGGPYNDSQSEFWYNVMPQAFMPLAGSITAEFDVDRVARFLAPAAALSTKSFAQKLSDELLAEPSLFHDLRQLLGISDKRAYLELSFLASRAKHPQANTGLCGCQPWNMARHLLPFFLRLISPKAAAPVRAAAVTVLVNYLLLEGLADAAHSFSALSATQLSAIYKTLVLPRESQQQAAKRRGHGCEGALATVLHACGVRVRPDDKHLNPMGAKDPNLDLSTLSVVPKTRGQSYSFDMLVLDSAVVRVAIQSLIHTSDPGQYGVNKSDETVAIANQVRVANRAIRPKNPMELWGLVDGVGFSENKADTINKMLTEFDCFVQLNTLYKAPLRLHSLGLCLVKAIQFKASYSKDDVDSITAKYVPGNVAVLAAGAAPNPLWTVVDAGLAKIYL